MRTTLTGLLAAAALASATVLTPNAADAGSRGVEVAAGILGGIAAGALIAGAGRGYAAPHYVAPYPVYAPAPRYYYYYYDHGPECYWRRERVWDGWGWRRSRVRVCY